jgi:2-phospho-L-lactate guanylyltransferase (CobY/MobA/RfbA family)
VIVIVIHLKEADDRYAAAHVKNVPGRKTDVNDAMWLAELLAHGLIRASFVPDTQTQEMRMVAADQRGWL